MQIKPHPALAHLVRHYLVLNSQQPVSGTHRLFADGNTGLVFNLENRTSLIYGQVNTWHDLSLSGNIDLIVVVFRPYGAWHLWGVPATALNDRFLPAEDVFTNINHLSAALLKSNLNERIKLLDNFLLKQLDKSIPPDPVLVQAVELIATHKGVLPVQSLLQKIKVNERTLERKFKLHTGISPKHFSGIVRLNTSAKRMQRMKEEDRLTGIAYESGYFDQAHFIKEFKKYTGITPHQYHQEVCPLALNFITLSDLYNPL